jgi:predicted nucleic acid-binding protein
MGLLAAVDASVVIAWQAPSDRFHQAATHLVAAWRDKVLSEVTLGEVLVGVPADRWPAFLSLLDRNGFTRREVKAEAMAGTKQRTGLKLPDACVLATAVAIKADAVLSFDDHLLQAAHAEGFATN